MKSVFCAILLASASTGLAATSSGINAVLNGVPAGTTEIVVLVDTIAPPAVDEYEDANPRPAAAAAAAPAAAARPGAPAAAAAAPADGAPAAAAAPAPRRRRAEAAPPPPVYRQSVAVNGGGSSVTVPIDVPAGKHYRIRAVALKGDGMYPSVLAGGIVTNIDVAADKPTEARIPVAAPKIELAPVTPAAVPAGAAFKLAGTITDPAGILGTKNRMRVWVNPGSPMQENYAGTQTSTTDVTTDGQKIAFHFDLTAPADPTTLYFQFGEISNEFVREDRRQAPFLVAPDFNAGAQPLAIRVESR